jgi:hypothetical protein
VLRLILANLDARLKKSDVTAFLAACTKASSDPRAAFTAATVEAERRNCGGVIIEGSPFGEGGGGAPIGTT